MLRWSCRAIVQNKALVSFALSGANASSNDHNKMAVAKTTTTFRRDTAGWLALMV